eukprot:TRINITY_DN125_c0_g1_i1.p1 TRINITY_DN125_c0_g1~~TRINITY_DN125_c0_g1_i1.p1  ORF type:complete len:275 (+),score=93.33 TRINITY_DN125_c0_g1_i1:223-1047(+)
MVLIREYRLVLPFTVEEYHIGQLYMVAKASKEQTGAGEGITIHKNEPYDDENGKGQYTEKTMHLGKRVPGWIRPICPKSALKIEEKAWNAYPTCKTQYSCPFFGKKFYMEVLTKHIQDDGSQENVHEASEEVLKKREVDFIDIAMDPIDKKAYVEEEDPTKFRSEKAGRGPLTEGWQKTSDPLMCAYKLVTVEFKYWGFQTKVEKSMQKSGMRDVFLKAHRQLFCWLDEWFGMTIEDIRQLEAETKAALDAKIEDPNAEVKPLGGEDVGGDDKK